MNDISEIFLLHKLEKYTSSVQNNFYRLPCKTIIICCNIVLFLLWFHLGGQLHVALRKLCVYQESILFN